MASSPVLVVGSLAFDDLEMPSGNFMNVTGGAATYCSLAISLFGPARVVGIVGDDFDGDMLKQMQRRGIDVSGIETVAGGKTFRWKGRYAHDLQSRTTLDTQLNVFANFQPKLPPTFRESPYVLLGNIHPALQLDVLSQVTTKPKLIAADTMNFWISGESALVNQVISKIDLLIINDEEARELSGIQNLAKAAADIRARGPKKLIIKRGEHGSFLFDEVGVFAAPTALLDTVLDPTGAGDSFAGGLLGSPHTMTARRLRCGAQCSPGLLPDRSASRASVLR
jgi:sugar/nucleoside kinase (ribokinase family)